MYIQWTITQPKRGLNNAIFSNLDGPRDYHNPWGKSNKETQICDITDKQNLKNEKKKDASELVYKTGTDSQRTNL